MAHLAEPHQLCHGTDRLLDRHRRVDAMQVIEIDQINTEPFERSIAGAPNIGRGAIDGAFVAGLPNYEAELCSQYGTRSPAAKSRPNLPLRHAVDVRRVEQGDS
jgi:hypothetical protein